jgi:hypothetical protein
MPFYDVMTKNMRLIAIFFCTFANVICLAGDSSTQGDSLRLTCSEFSNKIQTCIAIMKSKEPLSIKDAMMIVRVDNTLYMHSHEDFGDPAESFWKLEHSESSRLVQALGKWTITHGMGMYFEKFDLYLGGAPDNIRPRDAYDIDCNGRIAKKIDPNPNEAESYVASFLKSSQAIAARVGVVKTVSSAAGLPSIVMSNLQDMSMQGTYYYEVVGNTHTETFKVDWEKSSSTTPIKIIKIKGSDGETIQL